jgi:hypothetical protein
VRVATLALLTLTIQSVDRLPACVTGLRSLLRRNAKCLPEVERWYLGAARRKPAGSTRVLLPMQNLSSAVTDVIEGHSRLWQVSIVRFSTLGALCHGKTHAFLASSVGTGRTT